MPAPTPELGVNAAGGRRSDIVLRTMDLDDKARNLRFNWTIGKAGATPNIIPDEGYVEANIRYARRADLDDLLKALEDRILNRKKLPKSDIKITVDHGRPAFAADAAGKQMVEKAIAIYKEVGGELGVVPDVAEPDQEMVRDAVRDFAQQELWPNAARGTKSTTFPRRHTRAWPNWAPTASACPKSWAVPGWTT
jgi:acetylornithine deacetylase/succinyl-diaminopimelate desuccinylase-like protein